MTSSVTSSRTPEENFSLVGWACITERMDTAQTETASSEPPQRDRCYGCFRPKSACFCAAIPRIGNQTDVLILQHVRERFHPFNTARMVQRALRHSSPVTSEKHYIANDALLLKRTIDAIVIPEPPVKRK